MKTISGIGIGKKYGVKGKRTQRTRLILHRLEYLARPEKGKRVYSILKELPELPGELWSEYYKRFYTGDLGTFVEDAHSEIEEIAWEMEMWWGNLEEGGLGHTYKAEMTQECYGMLEDQAGMLGNLTTPDKLSGITLTISIPHDVYLLSGRSRNIGRGKRLENALAALRGVVYHVGEMLHEEGEWVDAVQEVIDELENVEFPGAYG